MSKIKKPNSSEESRELMIINNPIPDIEIMDLIIFDPVLEYNFVPEDTENNKYLEDIYFEREIDFSSESYLDYLDPDWLELTKELQSIGCRVIYMSDFSEHPATQVFYKKSKASQYYGLLEAYDMLKFSLNVAFYKDVHGIF